MPKPNKTKLTKRYPKANDTDNPVHSYVYLAEGNIQVRTMSLLQYEEIQSKIYVLDRWGAPTINYDRVTQYVNDLGSRVKLQVIDHRANRTT